MKYWHFLTNDKMSKQINDFDIESLALIICLTYEKWREIIKAVWKFCPDELWRFSICFWWVMTRFDMFGGVFKALLLLSLLAMTKRYSFTNDFSSTQYSKIPNNRACTIIDFVLKCYSKSLYFWNFFIKIEKVRNKVFKLWEFSVSMIFYSCKLSLFLN